MYNFIKNQPSSSVWINIIFEHDKLLEYYDGNNYWALAYQPSTSVRSNYFIISSVYRL